MNLHQPMTAGSRAWLAELISSNADWRANTLRDIWRQIDIKGENECWIWTGGRAKNRRSDEESYGKVRLGSKLQGVHRLIWISINGQIPQTICVRHTCDNPPCCNPRHLLSGTNFDNVRDRVERGRNGTVDISVHAKLTKQQVSEIRRRLLDGEVGAKIAREFDVSKTCINDIKLGKSYRNVPPLAEAVT
jgi:hypothetical protein